MNKLSPQVKVYYASILKVCRNHVPISPTTLVGPPFLTTTRSAAAAAANSNTVMTTTSVSSTGNPCLDLFFNVRLVYSDDHTLNRHPSYSPEYLKQLLPEAWSHSPLTTLKLIGNLLDGRGKRDTQGFYTAAYWLYQNHPKTLASNVPSFATFGCITYILELLYRTLQGGEDGEGRIREDGSFPIFKEIEEGIDIDGVGMRDKVTAMADKALERYRLDPNYRLLHDGLSDLFAQCFNHDIQNLKMMANGNNESQSNFIEMTTAATWCPCIDSSYDQATLLCESIAKKVFPRGSQDGSEHEEERHYTHRVREQLRKEVLLPLRKVLDNYLANYNETPGPKPEPCAVEAYFQEVKAQGMTKFNATALLPNEIISYVVNHSTINDDDDDDDDALAAAELQWKAMVDEVYLKRGKFKNCLAVCDVCDHGNDLMKVSVALGLLVSELSKEPWNGKAITFNTNPQLLLIQGHDLKSKYQFMSKMDPGKWDMDVDFPKVFDLILQAAVDRKLKPEQMVKKVFVFTAYKDFYQYSPNKWEVSDYEAIQTKFQEKGYGDVVPQIVFWDMGTDMSIDGSAMVVPYARPGVKVLSGYFNDNLVKSFLENDGDISLHHVVDAAISGEKYQDLVVVD